MDRRTAIDIYQWLREVCSTKLLSSPIVLGGPGVVVQIDESLFRHKPKVNKNISITIIKSKFLLSTKASSWQTVKLLACTVLLDVELVNHLAELNSN